VAYPSGFEIKVAEQMCELIHATYGAEAKAFKPNEKVGAWTVLHTLTKQGGGKGGSIGFTGMSGDDFLVCFRGTNKSNFDEVKTDLDITKKSNPRVHTDMSCHGGFAALFEKLADEVRKQATAQKAVGKAKRVLVTGHSLGAALALLAGLELAVDGHKDVTVYSFGTPKLWADAKIAKKYQSFVPKAFRIDDPEDPITKVGPFFHHETAWVMKKTPGRKLLDAHYLTNYYEIVRTCKD
jgi:predicted lipase